MKKEKEKVSPIESDPPESLFDSDNDPPEALNGYDYCWEGVKDNILCFCWDKGNGCECYWHGDMAPCDCCVYHNDPNEKVLLPPAPAPDQIERYTWGKISEDEIEEELPRTEAQIIEDHNFAHHINRASHPLMTYEERLRAFPYEAPYMPLKYASKKTIMNKSKMLPKTQFS